MATYRSYIETIRKQRCIASNLTAR